MICPECQGEFVDGVYTCADCGVPLVPLPLVPVDPDRGPEPAEPIPIEGEASWVALLRTGRLPEADLVASSLEEAGIPHYRQEVDSSGLTLSMPLGPAPGPGVWWVIQVPEAVADEARAVLDRLPVEVQDSPGIWDFGPTEKTKGQIKGLARAYLVLLAVFVLFAVLSLIRDLFR